MVFRRSADCLGSVMFGTGGGVCFGMSSKYFWIFASASSVLKSPTMVSTALLGA